jgi:hypothetical protein
MNVVRNAARKASPYKRHEIAAGSALYAAVPDKLTPGIARMLRASDIFWK